MYNKYLLSWIDIFACPLLHTPIYLKNIHQRYSCEQNRQNPCLHWADVLDEEGK